MTEIQATSKADAILAHILVNQEQVLGTSAPLAQADYAPDYARAIAAFRQELITQLVKQPA
jgi:hypothetical protein